MNLLVRIGFVSLVSFALLVVFNSPVHAQTPEKKIKFDFKNAELSDVIAAYGKASGETIVVDPGVHGKITIITPGEVTVPEAFSLLSTGMATNQLAIVHHGDTLVIESSRNALHDEIQVLEEVPPEKPEQLVTVVFHMKYLPPGQLYRDIRSLVSRDGEMMTVGGTDKLLVTDWVSSVRKIANVIAALDKPLDPKAPHEEVKPAK